MPMLLPKALQYVIYCRNLSRPIKEGYLRFARVQYDCVSRLRFFFSLGALASLSFLSLRSLFFFSFALSPSRSSSTWLPLPLSPLSLPSLSPQPSADHKQPCANAAEEPAQKPPPKSTWIFFEPPKRRLCRTFHQNVTPMSTLLLLTYIRDSP